MLRKEKRQFLILGGPERKVQQQIVLEKARVKARGERGLFSPSARFRGLRGRRDSEVKKDLCPLSPPSPGET